MQLQLDVLDELGRQLAVLEEEVELGNFVQVEIGSGFGFIIPKIPFNCIFLER